MLAKGAGPKRNRKDESMRVEPYLFFYGNCEEALNFYKNALGGEITQIMRFSEMPPDVQQQMPFKAEPNGIMHSTFKAGDVTFMAADGNPSTAAKESNISLSLGADSAEEGEKYFNALAAGGSVQMPFSDAFWGGKFGSCTDKFGIDWMVVSPH